MNKFSIVADGKQLDTYDNIAVSFNYQIEDILDITKRTTNYSKTITLPGTQFNNKFFKQIFDVNIDNITFNVKKSIPATIQIGEQNVLVGVLQLLNIIINQDAVDYEVVVMGQLKNIVNELGELTLRNLDFSEYNHTRTKINIQESWDYNIIKNNSLINQSGPGEGYVYPYIIYGNNQDMSNMLYASDLFPAVYLKTITDKYFDLAGYTYTSKFFNSDYFKKLILPFVDDKLQMTDEDVNNRTVIIGIDDTQGETTDPLQVGPIYTTSVTGYRAIGYTMSTDGSWYDNSTFYTNRGYWFPLQKETGTIIDTTLQDLNNEWTYSAQTTPYDINYSEYPYTFSKYVCQKSGYYDISMTGYMILKLWDVGTFAVHIEQVGGNMKYYNIINRKRGNNITTLASTGVLNCNLTDEVFTVSPVYASDFPFTLDVAASNVYLEEGDEIMLQFGFSMASSNWALTSDPDIKVQPVVLPSKDGVPTVLKIRPSNNSLVGANTEINMNQILPDIKLKDLFLSTIKMFNLVVFDNPEKANDLIIEPRDDFYASRQRVVDWTYKLDHNQNVKITPMSELDVKTFLYTYKEDGDYYNEQYDNETKRVYGDYEIDVENDFSNNQSKLEVLFSPTPDGQYGIVDRVSPFFCTIEENTLKPKKVKPRILFYGGLKDTSMPMMFKDTYDSSSFTVVDQYPYCGMWDDPFEPQYDLGFGTTSKIYWNGVTQFPTNTLVEQFHKNTLIDIIDVNSRLLEADFKLTPKDIADLDFRDIILIDNAYWRLNKIKDYNPIGTDKTTSAVLYKLNNINIFAPDRVELSLSNKSCPTDIIKKLSKQGAYYVSASGQILNANCCSSLNGDFIGGKCWVNTRLDGLSVDTGTKNLVIQGGTNITPNPQDRPEQLMAGNNTINSPGISVKGQSNYVDYGVKTSSIIGDNNSIINGSTNLSILGNNNTIPANSPNVYVFGNNNSPQVDLSNTGSTATTLSNVFIIGNNVTNVQSNTLYTDNIYMSSGSTINGIPISSLTGGTGTPQSLADTLVIGNTTGANDIIVEQNITTPLGGTYLDINDGLSEFSSTGVSLDTGNQTTDIISLDPTVSNIGTSIVSNDDVTGDKSEFVIKPTISYLAVTDVTSTTTDTITADPQGVGLPTGITSLNTSNNDFSRSLYTPTYQEYKTYDGATSEQTIINIQPLSYNLSVNGLTSSTSYLQSDDKIQLISNFTTSSYIQLNKKIIKSADIQTNDATITTIIDTSIASNSVLSIKASVVGIKTDNTKGYGSELYGVFRNNTGTVTQIGTTDLTEKSNFTTATSTIDFSGTNIRVRVTGEALTDINWSVQIEIINTL